jgi:abortive infection bacteriophage resistance protein
MANKESRTIIEQINLLKSRGLLIKDEKQAAFYLNNISYYRLKGYWWDMQTDKVNHIFAPNSYFEDVIERYNFDRQLRLILFDAIEFIEIALRTKLIYHLSQACGGLWYLNETLFENNKLYIKHIDELKSEFERSGEVFAKEFHRKHPNSNPDAWIIFEIATLGTLSKIYKNLKNKLPQKSIIANELGLNSTNDLSSWLETITYLRNIIAHHSRILGRSMVKQITIPKSTRNLWLNPATIPMRDNTKLFLAISAMIYLCNTINPNNEIKRKLLSLFQENPNIPISKIGFPENWQQEKLWSNNNFSTSYL